MKQITLGCRTIITLDNLETAGISFVPCGQVDGKDQPFLPYAHLTKARNQVTRQSYGKKWSGYGMQHANGVQLMTGYPTYRPAPDNQFYYYTSLDIEKRMREEHPTLVNEIVKIYREGITGTPCEIETKSGGIRLDTYSPYLGKKISFADDKGMLFEILAGGSLVRLDERYQMRHGSVLDMPIMESNTPLQEIHAIGSSIATKPTSSQSERKVVSTSELGELGVEWSEVTIEKDKKSIKLHVSQYFPTEHCPNHHNSNRLEVRFTKYPSGAIDGICWNCGENWWEIPPKHKPASQRIAELVVKAPPIEVRERASFPHFTKEERSVVKDLLSMDPAAGWHGQTPIFTTRYEYLHPLTNKFALNGQPSEVEKRRVWSTQFKKCAVCGGVTAQWIDRYLLTAGEYCDGCHKDYHTGSYLELELDRKLPNSIVSEHQGFLGDDPEFDDFRLWEPGVITHLGAGMSTGKSTEIYKQMIALALQGLGKGIIAVPLTGLTRFLAYLLRKRDGRNAWGVWHEGCLRSDRFIGKYGAIVCVPSLPRVLKSAEDAGISDRLYLAIDEVDFGYNLLSLSIEQATAVKKCLRDALNSTGVVVSGQTESTLALEALADELECEQVQAFYNTAKPADGSVVMHKHPNTDLKSNAILCGVIDDIHDALDDGHNVYTFCSTRRGGDIIADAFDSENPVVYNAYTKGNPRADAVLRNQRLTDSRLFIGTSAAGVGISILDPKARTIIASGINYGSRDASMAVQKGVRDRGRRGVSYHYTDYEFSLPVKPSESENVSLYHEALKKEFLRTAHISKAGIRKIAYAQALKSLADVQFEAFVAYHLGVVGNMQVHQASALQYEPDRIDAISTQRAEIRREEREKRIEGAIELLKEPYLLTTSEIRVLSNKGDLSPDARLAHETANATAQAVGWDNKIHGFQDGKPIKEIPCTEDLNVAIALAKENINTDKLTKQRRGYLAHQFPKWTNFKFQMELESADSQLVMDGTGLEITAIHDDRFLSSLIRTLLDRLVGKVFNTASLANTMRSVLASESSTGKTYGSELTAGALGAKVYRDTRFLHIADDERLVDWGRSFIEEWYPARIAKNDDTYTLQHSKHIDLRLDSFARWLTHQPGVPDNAQVDMAIIEETEPPDPDAEDKAKARQMRADGGTFKDIAEVLSRHPSTISKWCEDVKPKKKTKAARQERQRKRKQERIQEALTLFDAGHSHAEIGTKLGVNRSTVFRWLENRQF